MRLMTPPTRGTDSPAASHAEDEFLLGAQGVATFSIVLNVLLTGLLIQVVYSAWTEVFQVSQIGTWIGLTLVLLARYLMGRDRAKAAVRLLVWGATAVLIVQCFLVAGVRTPGLLYAPSLCIIAAWLLNLRSAIGVFVVFTITLLGFVLAERLGYQPPANTRPSLSIALVLVTGILVALAIAAGSITNLKKHLRRILELTHAQSAQLEALRLSEERFAALFRANPTPSSTVDDEGRTKDVNDAWSRLFGITEEQARNKTTAELGLWTTPEDRASVLAEYADKGRVDGMSIHLETAMGTRPFLLYMAPVEFNGRQRLVTSLVDQTDRLAAEAAQRAENEMLERRVAQRTAELSQTVARLTAAQEELVQSEKLASLGAMVAGISHELNTPIGNTVTVSSTLQAQVRDFRKLVDAGQLRKSDLVDFLALLDEMSDVIVRSTRRAAELVTSFKQVAVDRSSERRREFDVATLVQELVTALRPGMRQKHVEVSLNIPTGIHCDSFPGPVGQVVTNLIQNALTHAFSESTSGTIAIEVHSEGDLVVMQVRDDGKGMDEHTLKHAFDPFFTTRLGQGGSGLGLSVSHRIAHSVLGGTLTASSTPGQGSCFTFSFMRALP